MARLERRGSLPDFLFPQITDAARYAPAGWMPRLIDYLRTSLTNATAFSPTDTLVVARPVNILQG
jgi:hypothetical protein